MALFDDASLVTTPNGYKAGTLYSIKPTSGAGDMDVVRATTATRVNSAGLIESVAINVPRLDYTDSTCPSLLVEPQRTNLLTYSEDFSNASYSKSRSTFTSDSIQSPSGLINMGYLTEDTTANNTHYMRDFLTVTDGVNYTLSVFAKAKERDIICLGDNAAAQSSTGVWFDLTNGLVLTQRSGYVGSIKDFGNGIYRCSVTYSASASRQYVDFAISESDGVNIYTGDGTSGVYIWGAQLEVGSYATSYIPTVGSTVTRNADVISKTGISSLIGQTEGTLYFEVQGFSDGNPASQFITLNDGTTNNQIGFLYTLTLGRITGYFRVNSATLQITSTVLKTLNSKIILKYNSSNVYTLFINGSLIGTGTAASSFSSPLTAFKISQGNGGSPYNGKIKSIVLYQTALTNDQCIDLTT
jgi:hypothetical protein